MASHLQRGRLPSHLHSHLQGKLPCVTFVTVGEFYKGAYKARWGSEKMAELERWLRNVVVLPYTAEVSRTWGQITAESERQGRPLPPNDAWVAACCLSHNLPLMTLNQRHFSTVEGLVLIPRMGT